MYLKADGNPTQEPAQSPNRTCLAAGIEVNPERAVGCNTQSDDDDDDQVLECCTKSSGWLAVVGGRVEWAGLGGFFCCLLASTGSLFSSLGRPRTDREIAAYLTINVTSTGRAARGRQQVADIYLVGGVSERTSRGFNGIPGVSLGDRPKAVRTIL
jgi:hypothetical protein